MWLVLAACGGLGVSTATAETIVIGSGGEPGEISPEAVLTDWNRQDQRSVDQPENVVLAGSLGGVDRRVNGFLQFNLQSIRDAVPAGVTVTAVQLDLYIERRDSGSNQNRNPGTLTLHDASPKAFTPALTWESYRADDGEEHAWETPGGDFTGALGSHQVMPGMVIRDRRYRFESDDLVRALQADVDAGDDARFGLTFEQDGDDRGVLRFNGAAHGERFGDISPSLTVHFNSETPSEPN